MYTAEMIRPKHWTENIQPEPNSGCWLWTGRVARNGYGTWGGGRSGERISAHRLAWQEANGPVPDGLQVLHRCDVRCCVNPEHLFLGTARENTRDMMAKGRARFVGGAFNAAKTHCKRGHPFTADNTRFGSNGERLCRECVNLRARLGHARRKAAR